MLKKIRAQKMISSFNIMKMVDIFCGECLTPFAHHRRATFLPNRLDRFTSEMYLKPDFAI